MLEILIVSKRKNMKKSKIILMTLFGVAFIIGFYSFKDAEPVCSIVKNGRFHFYQDNGQYHSIVIRKDSLQTEVNLFTGDSSFWKILWVSDCQFISRFISSSKIKSQEELDFYKKSMITFNILKITEKYYTYEALFSSGNLSKSFNDTMWLIPK